MSFADLVARCAAEIERGPSLALRAAPPKKDLENRRAIFTRVVTWRSGHRSGHPLPAFPLMAGKRTAQGYKPTRANVGLAIACATDGTEPYNR
jgi:hypothetical protein